MSAVEHGQVPHDQRRKAPAQDVHQKAADRLPGMAAMATYLLDLQRTVGNATVNHMLQGQFATPMAGPAASTAVPVIQRGKETKERAAKRRAKRELHALPYSSGARDTRLNARVKADADASGESAITPPEIAPDGRRLWDGTRARLGFTQDTVDTVLAGTNSTTKKGISVYECSRCRKFFPQKGDAVLGKDGKKHYITLDHKKAWNEEGHGMVDEDTITDAAGHEWSVIYLDAAKAAANEVSNLIAMCNSCNSSKSAKKDTDHSNPTRHMENCAKCTASDSEGADTP